MCTGCAPLPFGRRGNVRELLAAGRSVRVEPETQQDSEAVTLEALRAREGEEVGVSSWVPVTQADIDAFADLTHDHQYIHVDPERAAASPFGTTVAHGFLTLSLLSRFAYEARPRLKGTRMSVNYGFDRLRFVAPVPSGARLRGRFRLERVEDSGPGEVTLHWGVTVEIEGEDRPAIVADWITRAYLEEG
jgi:acyl dehydratase